MTAIRQDAWSENDDLVLAEVTLRNIREGGTQLGAFEEVGDKIGRTSAACGFRWNSCVRKKYEAAIQIAKAQRQKRSQIKKGTTSFSTSSTTLLDLEEGSIPQTKQDAYAEESISIDAVIRYLKQWKGTYIEMNRQIKMLEKLLREREDELHHVKRDKDRMNKEMSEVQTDYRMVNDDYRALIQIMDRARKMAFLVEEEDENKPRFRMDANGNLERIEK